MNYHQLKSSLQLSAATKWLPKDSEDDFYPDALGFSDVTEHLDQYLTQRQHRILQVDTYPHVTDSVPKANGMYREAVWLHPNHRILYLATLHYLLPKLDHHLPAEVYSYRRDSDDPDRYPFPDKMGRWRTFHNDFRHSCLDESTQAILITDIASYFDHIHVNELCSRIGVLLGDAASEQDKEVVAFLQTLLRQWSTQGYGIPQNLDASSFYGSLFLSGADREMLDKRYRYFRWVDDIRICASSKKQAQRALQDLQASLARYRMFLASDKTKIILKGTKEFDELLDVEDDSHISRLEDVVARGNREEIERELSLAQRRLEHHASSAGDDRKFRAFSNRLMQIGEYEEFRHAVYSHLEPFAAKRLESHPNKSDYWSKVLQESCSDESLATIEKLLIGDPSIFNWQRFYLWRVLTAQDSISPSLLAKAKSLATAPVSDLEASQAIICAGKHGDNNLREALFVQHFSQQRSHPIQRALIVAIQGLNTETRNKLYDRAVETCPDHTQLVATIKALQAPRYGVKLRSRRSLPDTPRSPTPSFLKGVGLVNGVVVRYRLSRRDYDYE